MPLHDIPLCEIKYVGNTLSAATFKYDVRNCIEKNESKFIGKDKPIEIEKNNNKMAYKVNVKINKSNYKLFYKENLQIKIASKKYLYIKNRELKTLKSCCINRNNDELLKEIKKDLNKNNIIFDKNKIYNIEDMKFKYITLKHNDIYLKTNTYKELNKSVSFQFKKDNLEFTKAKTNLLDSASYKEILYTNKSMLLNKLDLFSLDKLNTKNLFRSYKELNYNLNNICLDKKEKVKEMNVSLNKKHLFRGNIKQINKTLNNLLMYKDIGKKINLKNYLFLDKEIYKNIGKTDVNKLFYKTYKDIFTNKIYKDLSKNKVINIETNNLNKLMYKIASKNIYQNSFTKLFYKQSIIDVFKSNENYLNRYSNNDIYLKHDLNLVKSKNIILSKNNINFVKNISFKNISRYDLYELNKSKKKIFVRFDDWNLKKARNVIDKENYNTEFLEVIKRWWILGVTGPYDKKILPYDYNYNSNPLQANKRDKNYGELINIDKHPISYMPYLEKNKGIDLNYGVKEINLSIEIMLDMVNIVGMIVQHSASQFVNCSGQEAIEFINEILLEWLNLDSTIKYMQFKSCREHYLRVYRWIRWESEKVWFMADKDHTQDKMMGLRYANMIFANLIDYIKYHHFDLVPLWRNLKSMDIERQFNRIANNGDIIKDLNKIKGKRHYFIETKHLEKKNILGGK